MSLFHGRLKIHIKEARNLKDMDWNLFARGDKDTSDPYVTGALRGWVTQLPKGTGWGNLKLFKTEYINDNTNPNWDMHYDVYVCHTAKRLMIKVKDKDDKLGKDDTIGAVEIEADDLLKGVIIL